MSADVTVIFYDAFSVGSRIEDGSERTRGRRRFIMPASSDFFGTLFKYIASSNTLWMGSWEEFGRQVILGDKLEEEKQITVIFVNAIPEE